MTRDWQPVIDKMLPDVRAANERVAATYGATLAEHMEVFQRQVDARGGSYEAAEELLRQVRAGEKPPGAKELSEHVAMLMVLAARPAPRIVSPEYEGIVPSRDQVTAE